MYIPAAYAETDLRVLKRLIHDNPFGLFTTGIKSPTHSFLQSTHLPFLLDEVGDVDETGHQKLKLRGHIARKNPQCQAMMDSLRQKPPGDNFLDDEVLLLFTSPAQHYITTKFYKGIMSTHRRAAPTWNYAAVQVYGRAKIFYDTAVPETGDFLTQQLEDLSHHTESTIMGHTGGEQPEPWRPADAPSVWVEALKKNIVGIEIEVERMEGKVKMSQDKAAEDHQGVIEGLADLGSDAAKQTSVMVQATGKPDSS